MSRGRGILGALIRVTGDDDLKARGLANQLDELDMVISPVDGSLVPVAMKHGLHVCWGCCEPFDEEERPLRKTEIRTPGSVVRVLVHARCVDPKNRKPFSDMGGSRSLQSVDEVSAGLKLRKTVARAVKPFVQAAQAAVSKVVL